MLPWGWGSAAAGAQPSATWARNRAVLENFGELFGWFFFFARKGDYSSSAFVLTSFFHVPV